MILKNSNKVFQFYSNWLGIEYDDTDGNKKFTFINQPSILEPGWHRCQYS